mmetsp:Transcript_68802/g.188838  ORF Transcript_68802/g.188838 Transcript_68802/m.188838 type:complete len:222 (-) Transcript_68802:178-843(-)
MLISNMSSPSDVSAPRSCRGARIGVLSSSSPAVSSAVSAVSPPWGLARPTDPVSIRARGAAALTNCLLVRASGSCREICRSRAWICSLSSTDVPSTPMVDDTPRPSTAHAVSGAAAAAHWIDCACERPLAGRSAPTATPTPTRSPLRLCSSETAGGVCEGIVPQQPSPKASVVPLGEPRIGSDDAAAAAWSAGPHGTGTRVASEWRWCWTRAMLSMRSMWT